MKLMELARASSQRRQLVGWRRLRRLAGAMNSLSGRIRYCRCVATRPSRSAGPDQLVRVRVPIDVGLGAQHLVMPAGVSPFQSGPTKR